MPFDLWSPSASCGTTHAQFHIRLWVAEGFPPFAAKKEINEKLVFCLSFHLSFLYQMAAMICPEQLLGQQTQYRLVKVSRREAILSRSEIDHILADS
jgi:hypothetical protein